MMPPHPEIIIMQVTLIPFDRLRERPQRRVTPSRPVAPIHGDTTPSQETGMMSYRSLNFERPTESRHALTSSKKPTIAMTNRRLLSRKYVSSFNNEESIESCRKTIRETEQSTRYALRQSGVDTDRKVSFFEDIIRPIRVQTQPNQSLTDSKVEYSIQSKNLGDLLTGVKISKLLPYSKAQQTIKPTNLQELYTRLGNFKIPNPRQS